MKLLYCSLKSLGDRWCGTILRNFKELEMTQLVAPIKAGLFIIFCSTILACSKKSKPHKLDYKEIETGASGNTVNFCESFSFDWDSVLLISPYMPAESWENLELKNLSLLRDELEAMESIDWMNSLVFIKGKEVTAYTQVPRGYADFKLAEPASNPVFLYRKNCVLKVSGEAGRLVLIVPATFEKG